MARPTVADEIWVDPAAREALAAAVYGSQSVADRFIGDFIESWAPRIERLTSALAGADAEDAYVTLLSIRSGAQMVGAVELTRFAAELESCAHVGRLDSCRERLDQLRVVGQRTIQELRAAEATGDQASR